MAGKVRPMAPKLGKVDRSGFWEESPDKFETSVRHLTRVFLLMNQLPEAAMEWVTSLNLFLDKEKRGATK